MTPRWRLFTKYAAFIIALVSAALLASGGTSVYFSYQETRAQLVTLQQEKANAAATRIEQYIRDVEQQLGWTALPQASTGGNVVEQRRFEYLKLLRQAPAITEVAWMDNAGREQLKVSRLAMDVIGGGTDISREPRFTQAKAGRTYYSPVYFRKETEPYMTISRAAGGEGGGVTVAEVNLKFVWEVVSQLKIGRAGLAYVVNSQGILIAHPDISLVLQRTDLNRLPQVAALKGPDKAAAGGMETRIARDLTGQEVLTANAPIPTLDWNVLVELPLAEAFEPLYASLARTGLLLLLGFVLSVVASIFLARRMVQPIRALQQGAARIGAGNLDQRIEVHTGDELEALSEHFNKMASDLKAFYAGLERKVEERTAELKESLEQQTAMSEILRVISSSPTDIQPVLDAVAESAARLCNADDVVIRRVDGDVLPLVAHIGPVPISAENLAPPISSRSIGGRVIRECRTMHVHDVLEPRVREEYPEAMFLQHQGTPYRTMLILPLVRENAAIGTIVIRRLEVRPFSDKQIKLLETFAAQAVIAIENVRLFKELEARNKDLAETLEQQTATAEILKVISSSPTDTQPVFDAIVKSGVHLFGGMDMSLRLVKGENTEPAASTIPLGDADKYPVALSDDGSPSSRAIRRREVVQVPDLFAEKWVSETARQRAMRRGFRAILCAPMLKENVAIGAINVLRASPGPFTEKEIALLRTFANQAVIAIENVRLFNETKEALEQQTVISEILRVISSSPTDVQPVFDAIVKSGLHLFDGLDVSLRLLKGDRIELAATTLPAGTGGVLSFSHDGRSAVSRSILRREVVQIPDVTKEDWIDESVKQTAERRGIRASVTAPMLRENDAIGAIVVTRATPGLFTDKQVSLLKTFADQAVIAIENVRLFKELQARNAEITEALEQQMATSEILRVISSSPTDVQPVFDAIVNSGVHLFGGLDVSVLLTKGDQVELTASTIPPVHVSEYPLRLKDDGTVACRAILTREFIQVPDVFMQDWTSEKMKRLAEGRGFRAVMAAPLMREDNAIGVIAVTRASSGPFTDKQVALLKTFASQAVIAIENVRLFNEINEALQRQTSIAEILRVISSSPTDVMPVLDAVTRGAAQLCDAPNARLFLVDGEMLRHVTGFGEFKEILATLPLTRGLVAGRAILDQTLVHIEDISSELDEFPEVRALALQEQFRNRTVLAVPLVRENKAFGALVMFRTEVRPFSVKQVELAKTFADQATIAIQNVRLFKEIQDKSRQLEIANKHKSEFLANMSHELRTPLNSIIGFSEVLVERMFGEMNAKQEEYLRDIHSSGEHLLSLINDILDLSKIEAGHMELNLTAFDPGMALENSVTLVKERAARRGIKLRLEVDKALDQWVADERKFKQIMLNLLSNAVKFTPEGGRINVKAGRNDANLVVAVRDTGVGIKPEDQALIFEEFRQVGSDYTKKAEGTGLGLALTRKLVELHGGRIWVESAEGKGSTFTFTLPAKQGAPT